MMMRAPLGAILALALAGCSPSASIGPDRLFVSDEAANVVHVLDGQSGRSEGELRTGRRPRGMALSPDRRVLYVAASDDNRIEAWDVIALRRLRSYAGGSDPERFALARDGRSLFIANEDQSLVSKLDLGTGAIVWQAEVGPEPEGIAVSPDGRLAVATAEASSTAHFIDSQTGEVLASALVGTRPRDVLFLPRSEQIWVSSEQRGTLAVFDRRSLAQVALIDLVPAFPDLDKVQTVEMEVTRDGRRAFVAMGRSDRVAEINPANRRVVRSFATGHRTWGLALSPDETRLYAVSGLSGDLTVIDLASNRVTRTVRLGGKPWGVEAVAR